MAQAIAEYNSGRMKAAKELAVSRKAAEYNGDDSRCTVTNKRFSFGILKKEFHGTRPKSTKNTDSVSL